jgi:hypothetical protein
MNVSSLPNPSENTFVEITQDGRHAVYLTDEQLILISVMFGNIRSSNEYRLEYHNYNKLLDYCEENKLIDNNTILNINLAKCLVLDLATQTEKFVLEYQHLNNTGV